MFQPINEILKLIITEPLRILSTIIPLLILNASVLRYQTRRVAPYWSSLWGSI